MNILLIGVQGSGKGTQGKRLSEETGYPHISSGDVLRDVDETTEIGRKVNKFMEKGELVPIDIMTQLFKNRVAQSDAKNGVIIEGYPRKRKQAQLLEKFLPLDHVIVLDLSDQEGIRRLSGRRTCVNKDCDAIYNVNTAPKPQKEGICDNCGSKIVQREDDTPDAVRRRMEIYHNETKPLIDFYRSKDILSTVNADQSIEEVHNVILSKLEIGN
jgi:adenylate kinase